MEYCALHYMQLPKGLKEKADHQRDMEIQTHGHMFKNNFFNFVPLTTVMAAL